MEIESRTFDQLGLSSEMLGAVKQAGFQTPSAIQVEAIPILLEGNDLVGQSQTGSGKTAAYTIPSLEQIEPEIGAVQFLILAPTRELVIQVVTEVEKLSAFHPQLHTIGIYGGASYGPQLAALRKGVQIVVGTPGRLIDHLNRGSLSLENLRFIVLDEADRMLDMGFREDIETILEQTPEERQTLFFSATLPKSVRQLITKYSSKPEWIHIEQENKTATTIDQIYYEVPARAKKEALLLLITAGILENGIIFCNTQRLVEEVGELLIASGMRADKLHGGMAQAQRTRVMDRFKKGQIDFLVATDVAGRGIDVSHLESVINYELSAEVEDYIHRIGRTGRAGRSGQAITLLSKRDFSRLRAIERYTKTKLRAERLPTQEQIAQQQRERLLKNIDLLIQEATEEEVAFTLEQLDSLLASGKSLEQITFGLWHLLQQPIHTRQAIDASKLIISQEENFSEEEKRKKDPKQKKAFSGARRKTAPYLQREKGGDLGEGYKTRNPRNRPTSQKSGVFSRRDKKRKEGNFLSSSKRSGRPRISKTYDRVDSEKPLIKKGRKKS